MKKFLQMPVYLIFVIPVAAFFFFSSNTSADHLELFEGKKVLVVASYHKGYKWCDDIIRSLEHNLAGVEMTIFYMDTKRNLDGAVIKGKEAYALYKELQPDVVITIDDNAQAYFVVPYLRNEVKTPVIFCGVNDDATKYGFPAKNVTGVLEKKHYRESISFAQLIKPEIRTIGVIYRPSPSNQTNVAQIEQEKGTYSADVIAKIPVNSVRELRKAIAEYATTVDAFMLLNMTGITDENGQKVEGHDAIAMITDTTDRVTIGASDWEVEAGALCGVVKSGEEQGQLAAKQLIALWEGKPLEDLQVLQNKNGQRFINLNTIEKLKIKLRPEMVIGSKIISEK